MITKNSKYGLLAIGLFGLLTSVISCRTPSQSQSADVDRTPQNFQPDLKLPFAWIELGPKAVWIARVITDDKATCPILTVDSTPIYTALRAKPEGKFPVRVCEAIISPDAKQIQLDGKNLPVPKKDPQRILVIGDTGCRMTHKAQKFQKCDSPESWPFPVLAAEAARLKPDLVIHVGDMIYREHSCPEGEPSCAGSPHGKNWKTWEADFFLPAEPLLAQAPWVVARGNHEDCKRNWEGWFRFLDPTNSSSTEYVEDKCPTTSDPYSVDIGNTQLVVADSSSLSDTKFDPQKTTALASKFTEVLATNSADKPQRWLITHKPVWGFAAKGYSSEPGQPVLGELNALFDKAFLKNFQLALVGHVHVFHAVSFQDTSTAQFIVGNGGAHLTNLPQKLPVKQVGDRKIKNAYTLNEFGFLLLERDKKKTGWNGKVYDRKGKIALSCKIKGSQIECGG